MMDNLKPGKEMASNKRAVNDVISKYGIYIILLAVIFISALLSDVFFTAANILNISRQISVITIVAIGQMFIMVSGGIDLSVGAQLAVSGLCSIAIYLQTQSMGLAIAGGIGVGALLGTINGVLTSFIKIPAFIVTLSTTMIYRGVVLTQTGGQVIADVGDFAKFGQEYLGPIPLPIIVMILVVIFAEIVLRQTILGRRMFAVGGNYDAARASGIRVSSIQAISFILCGALTGLAGVTLLSRLNSGIPTIGEGSELDSIAAAVIGGTSMTGGMATAVGVLVGSLIIGVINNILGLMGVLSYIQDIIKGIIIIVAVFLDMQTKKKMSKA